MANAMFVLFPVITKKEKNGTEFWKKESKLINMSKVLVIDSDLEHLDKSDYDLLSIEFDIKKTHRLKLEDGSYLIIGASLEEFWKILNSL